MRFEAKAFPAEDRLPSVLPQERPRNDCPKSSGVARKERSNARSTPTTTAPFGSDCSRTETQIRFPQGRTGRFLVAARDAGSDRVEVLQLLASLGAPAGRLDER